MSYNSDLREIIRKSTAQGWRHQLTEKGHHQFYAPDGKNIIVASGSTCNDVGWRNFLADMKRCGYTEESLGTLADVMPAGVLAQAHVKAPTDQTTSQMIMALMARHPNGMPVSGIHEHLRMLRPITLNAVHQALAKLALRGQLVRHTQGFYMLPNQKTKVEVKAPVAIVVDEKVKAAAGQHSGDPQVDDDLKALDEALSALAKIESVVRRNRDVLHQLAQLKQLLNRIGSGA